MVQRHEVADLGRGAEVCDPEAARYGLCISRVFVQRLLAFGSGVLSGRFVGDLSLRDGYDEGMGGPVQGPGARMAGSGVPS
jgi:hypothetical protein